MENNKILLVSNSIHIGITLIAEAYKKAFEVLGIDFEYYYDSSSSIEILNHNLYYKISTGNYKIIIFIQPSYLTTITATYLMLIKKQQGIRFFSINTDDPYSTETILSIQHLFDKKFTNEKIVAESFSKLGFIYLPLAFDHLYLYKKNEERNIDLCYICTFYKNRMDYLKQINEIQCKKYIAGSIMPLFEMQDQGSLSYDISMFNQEPKLIPHHKELESYSMSKFVINPIRLVNETGIKVNVIMSGIKCRQIVNSAVSPNPRFFNALGCGAIPLCNIERTTIMDYMNIYFSNCQFPILLPKDNIKRNLEKYIETYDSIDKDTLNDFISNENYIKRSEFILNFL